MTDVKTQLVRLGAHLDDTVPRIDDDELARRIAILENATYRPRPKPRGAVIAVAAAIAALVLVGAVPLILDLLRTDDTSPATELPPQPTAVSSAPTAAPTAPPATSAPPATTVPQTTPEAAPPFDYAEVGEYAGTLETKAGNLEFFALTSVPYVWIEDGFPKPGGAEPDPDFRTVWANAHSGLEIFETDGGFLGLGSTAGPDAPRIMTGYMGSFFRVRGVGTQAEFEKAFHQGAEGMEIEYWGEDSGTWCCATPDEDWFHFVPAEAWFSADGIEWEPTASEPFGPDTVMLSQPRSVAEHNGTWMVLGWTGVGDPADLVGSSRARPPGWPLLRDRTFGQPAMWTSTDLKTWTQVPFDFGAPGWDTTLESVVGSEAGWLAAGKRESHETPRDYDSLVWFSRDGVDWVELPMEELVGLPHCGPFERPETCLNGFGPEFVPGGIGVYAWHRTATGEWGWTLWVGRWED